jgi:acetyltransferase-like isoleucine patch superfamily enzyme
MWLRRLWYRRTLAACGDNLYVDFLAAIRTAKTRVGHHVHVGVECWVGWAELGDDVMLGGHIVVLSGLTQHTFDRLDVPMRAQPGSTRCIRVGRDVWVGNGAIIGADVSEGSVVAAGSVVTKTFPPFSVLAGVPARVVGNRRDPLTADAAAE